MLNIIIGEFEKLKRHSVLWIGIVTVSFSAVLAAFQTGTDAVPGYQPFYNNVIWNNFSLVFPFMIVLIGGFLIDREYTDNTLKTMLTVPVSFRKMLVGKLIVTGILTILSAVFSFACTVILAVTALHCTDMTPMLLWMSFAQIAGVGFFNFLAVAPFPAWFSRKRNGFFTGVGIAFFYGFCGIFVAGRNLTDFYPITAGLGIIRYTGQDGAIYNPVIGTSVLLLVIALTMVIVAFAPSYDRVMAIPAKKS
jgi:hypothetical protein